MNQNHKGRNRLLALTIVFLYGFSILAIAQEDHTHFSKVFNKEKAYRIFLPSDYNTSQKRYPVIYYFHGNTGNHELNIDDLPQMVNENSVILVAWNGRSVETDFRPYNIGNHSNINYQVQFKDYFLELVMHIDSTFRTLTDRSNRAVIGHSMGGIMSFFIAGKYPEMIGTAVNSKGSPEFFIGYPKNHTLYNVRYMFKNLYGVRLMFTNSTDGELVNLNNEVNAGALNEKDLNYVYRVYEGGHSLSPAEFKDLFNFVISSFQNPLPAPKRWTHADLYPNFDVWGYEVKSNLSESGYIEMKGVTKEGMGIATKKWQPEGRLIPGVTINIKTPPIYIPETTYSLLDYNLTTNVKNISNVKSDSEGKINFSVNYENHQIGISKKGSPADVVFVAHRVSDNGIFLEQNEENELKIRLLNRGGSNAKGLKVTLTSSTKGVSVANPTIEVEDIPANETAWLTQVFKVTARNKPTVDGSPFRIRFNIAVSDNNNQLWEDEFDAPVFYDVPEFTNIGIDDGDSEMFGAGNGDNTAQPGEWIMVYEITNGSHRTRLYCDDPYIDGERLYDEVQPDKWGDGYSLSSIVHISKDCPPGHKIMFLANYEVKDWKAIRRDLTWGKFTIIVGDNDDK
ncbi:MAG TPA: alpha/beta hydrolase-fold protein [Draconibacterium sp.]|nr:alpha/beta hydrolase-fold protein [Draconibacterium sp.]